MKKLATKIHSAASRNQKERACLEITNSKIQITNKFQNTNYNIQNSKGNGVFEIDQALDQLMVNPKGGHGLPKDSFRLQTMTAFNQKLLWGVQGGGFLEKSPPGRRRQKNHGDRHGI
ncbi:hypothetical protein ACFLQP_02685 [Acidobacteriota bacterium]